MNKTRELIKLGLIATPLMSISSIMPFVLHSGGQNWMFITLVINTLIVLLSYWVINISLVYYLQHFKRSTLRIILSIVLTLFVGLFLSNRLRPTKPQGDRHPPPDVFKGSHLIFPGINAITNNLIILMAIEIVLSRIRIKETANEMAELKHLNLEAYYNRLRQQFEPHFLFNSLNNLNGLIRHDPVQANRYVIRLSEFLRQNVLAEKEDPIQLDKEVAMCKEYLELQKMRYGDSLIFSFSNYTNENLAELKIPVFSLQTLVENAIKHNQHTTASPLKITIEIHEKQVCVSNNLQRKSIPETSTRIGLLNLNKRLQLINATKLVVEQTLEVFKVIVPLVKR